MRGPFDSPLVRKIWALSSSQASCEIFFAMVRDLLQSTLFIYIYIDLSPYPPAGLGSSSKVLLVTSRLWNLHSNVSTPTLQLFPSYPTPVLPFVHPPLSSFITFYQPTQLPRGPIFGWGADSMPSGFDYSKWRDGFNGVFFGGRQKGYDIE